MLYNLVHIFLHGSMSGFYVFVLCLPTLWVPLLLGLFGWNPLLSFRNFSLTCQHNVWDIGEGQSKIEFIFLQSLLSLKLFLTLWSLLEAVLGTKMHVLSAEGLEFGFLLGVLLVFPHFLLVIIVMDLAWQIGPKHILSYFVFYMIKGKWKLQQPFADILVSKLSLGNLSLHNFWTKQIKGTFLKRTEMRPWIRMWF